MFHGPWQKVQRRWKKPLSPTLLLELGPLILFSAGTYGISPPGFLAVGLTELTPSVPWGSCRRGNSRDVSASWLRQLLMTKASLSMPISTAKAVPSSYWVASVFSRALTTINSLR